ncbi:MAG: hypothetical protein WC847_02580 [Candidatus Paceibacterota bacterium]|jgi:hypothetical protein
MTQEEQYLPEDQELLDELEAINPLSTGQALEEQKKRIQVIEIKALLKSRKSADTFSKTTTRFSIIIAVFTLIQIVIASMQFTVSILSVENKLLGIFLAISFIVIILWIIQKSNELLKDK